ncbi:DUF3592 domain-containing protein [Catenovulum sp. SM1970]|uniref:DUF3592 domain-containing protein n=1 Tax=Marinifaba aquimaris TaxID=2741323 RepID=UPI00157258A8|nr:DUF3592 domain-containing protein [Marinifaba aquimaris]NTS75659.1 DUF3592 domain-containing protein [Marinifaba aquimaris]
MTVLVIIAAVAASIGLFKLKSSDNWQQAQAELEFIDFERVSTYNQSSDRDVNEYLIKLRYQYQVQGQQYSGDQVYAGLGNAFSKQKMAEQLVAQYQGKQQITIFFNPQQPSKSALKQANLSNTAMIWLLVTIWGIGALIIFAYNKFFAH